MPSSVSIRLLTELYGMNIPIFVPTPKFYQEKSNSLQGELALERISQFDLYKWPHIILFESWNDLISKLKSFDLIKVRKLIKQQNNESKRNIIKSWKEGILKIR